MKRYNARGGNAFARFGIHPHFIRLGSNFRGGNRR